MNTLRCFSVSLATIVLVCLCITPVHADLVWNPTKQKTGGNMDGSGTWSASEATWWNGTANVLWPSSVSSVATFGSAASGTSENTVTISEMVTAGGINFAASTSGCKYSIENGTINSPRVGVFQVNLSGGNFFIFNILNNVSFKGAGTYQFDTIGSTGTSNQGGGVVLAGETSFDGNIQAGNGSDCGTIILQPNCVASGRSITVTGGAESAWTLYVNTAGDYSMPLYLSGLGNRGNGTLCLDSGGEGFLTTFSGPIVLKSDASIFMGNHNGVTYTVSGAISGNANLYLGAYTADKEPGKLTQLVISSTHNTYTGATILVGDISKTQINAVFQPIVLGANNVLPITTTLILGQHLWDQVYPGIPSLIERTIHAGGAWLTCDDGANSPNTVVNTALDLHGYNQQVAGLAVGGGCTGSKQWIGNLANGTVATLIVSGSTSCSSNAAIGTIVDNTFDGVITDHFDQQGATGKVAFTKVGPCTLTLSGSNSYSGPTFVTGGTLAITAPQGLGNTAQVDIQRGATFDVSKITDGYTLNASQTLMGGGTVKGDLITLGTLQPHDASSVTATLNTGNLTLANNAVISINVAANSVSDTIRAEGTITLGQAATDHIALKINFLVRPGNAPITLLKGSSLVHNGQLVYGSQPLPNNAVFTVAGNGFSQQFKILYGTADVQLIPVGAAARR